MSDYLLDTNVVSETARPSPAARVVTWLSKRERLLVSSVSWFEIRRGIDALPSSKRRRALEAWLGTWVASGVEVLPFDREAADQAARIELEARSTGRTIDFRDLFVVATAAASGLTMATRNTTDFAALGVAVVDPFTESAI